MFFSLLIRDLTIYSRNKGNWINPLVFIFISITLFTIGIGPDIKLEINHSISIIWVVCVLSIMLCLNSLFVDDFEDGSLEQILLSPQPSILLSYRKFFLLDSFMFTSNSSVTFFSTNYEFKCFRYSISNN